VENLSGLPNISYPNIPLLAPDRRIIEFGNWYGSNTITLEIDHGSDGTIDENVPLENQMRYVFLPVLNR
jgi:hypothetical protein